VSPGFGAGRSSRGPTVLPIVYASVVGLLLACSDSTGPSEPSIKSPPTVPTFPAGAFQVSPVTATLQNGQTFRFTTTYSGNPALLGIPGDVIWHSSDENVATVSGGLVRAASDGQARIVVIWGGFQAHAIVRVMGSGKKQ
jgi:Bacterial Ig-like domain (group 2)